MTASPSTSIARESEARRRWSGVGGGLRRGGEPRDLAELRPAAGRRDDIAARPRVTPVPA